MSISKKFSTVFAIISAIGILDSAYLTYEHYNNLLIPCSFNNGCEIVTKSAYSVIYGIPLAALGVIYYVIFFTGSIISMKKLSFTKLLAYFSLAGFATSVYLVYLQLFVLHAICQYCILSAFTSTTLFVTGIYYLKHSKANLQSKDENE